MRGIAADYALVAHAAVKIDTKHKFCILFLILASTRYESSLVYIVHIHWYWPIDFTAIACIPNLAAIGAPGALTYIMHGCS